MAAHATPPTAGEDAPPIALPDHDGTTWTLSDRLGRPVVLIFHRHLA